MDLLRMDCLSWMEDQEPDSVDLVFSSPPYPEKGTRYGGSNNWKTDDWVAWMLEVTREAARVSNGYVMWVVNGAIRQRRYLPACEGLVYLANQQGIVCERPCIWHKNAPPSRKDWFGNDWEYVLAFRSEDSQPYFDWEAVAQPPKYTNGGRFRQRTANGDRRLGSEYPTNKLARPRDVIRATVGGCHMGYDGDDSRLACQGKAPFPVKLAEHFIKACSPPGGTVLDPFVGAGTTAVVCQRTGRRCIGIDILDDQLAIARERICD